MDKPSLQVSQQIPQSSKPFCPNVIEDLSLNWCELLRRVNPKEFHKPVHPKGNQSCIFIGRTDDEAKAPILCPPDGKSWLIWKDPDAGKDWRQEEKGMTENEMVGWHHQLYGHEFEQAPGAGDGQGSLACCSPWGRRVRHDWVTELNWTSYWDRPCYQSHPQNFSLNSKFLLFIFLRFLCPLRSVERKPSYFLFCFIVNIKYFFNFLCVV